MRSRFPASTTPLRKAPLVAVALLAALTLFASNRHERTVVPAGPGPNRLDVDATILDGARPLQYEGSEFRKGLEDLRLRVAARDEVPYVLVPPPTVEERWISARPIAIPATKKKSGFEIDIGRARRVDAIRVGGLPAPFLKRMRVEASGDRARWVTAVADGTLFDLPDEGLASTKTVFDAGEYRFVRLVWDDRSSATMPLPATVEVRDASRVPAPPAIFDASFARRPSEPGHSRFRITLPAAGLPAVALVVDCGEPTLLRGAAVNEIRLGGSEAAPVPLGKTTLRRVEREGAVADSLRIPIEAPIGPDLELVVDDGDNPPLRLEGVRVELPALPWIYFESADGRPITARWGDPSAGAPRYDIAAKAAALQRDDLPRARWSGTAVMVDGDERPADSSTPFVGAAIDRAGFRFVRAIPATGHRLVSLLVDAATLAHSNRLADVRIIDPAGRQIPYLLERRDEPLEVPLTIPARTTGRAGQSLYEIELPYDSLPDGTRLVLTTGARVFERRVTVRAMRVRPGEREPRILSDAEWTSADDGRAAPSLDLPIRTGGLDRIAVEINEGDNAPLALATARLLLPMTRLRFVHPGGDGVVLAYGNPTLATPRYDLALLAPRLFGESADEIVPGPEPSPSGSGPMKTKALFWAVIIVSAIALLIIIARMLRGETT